MLIQIITSQPLLHNPMFSQIMKGTPLWVWGLLAALLALGLSQLAGRQLSLRRVILVPLAMLGLSLFGMLPAFGGTGQLGPVLLAWLGAGALVTALMLRLAPAAGSCYDAASRRFVVPGSVLPLLLILGIFMTKYVVGIELALQPAVARDAAFALPVGLIYGAFNGLFAARALRLLRLAQRGDARSGHPAQVPA